MKGARFRALAAFGVVSSFGVPCRADPSEPTTVTADAVALCVGQHDDARLLRLGERWLEARAALTRCAEPSCPLAIRSDCSAWLAELATVLPTLLVVVERDDGGGPPVTLEIDGQTFDLPVEVGPIEVLPGKHTLRFTLGSYPAVEQTLELRKGEKNRVVAVRFTRAASAAPLAERQPPRSPPNPPEPAPSRPIPLLASLSAAGAVVLLATSGVLLASALHSKDSALERCAPECHDGEREAIDARLLAADIVAGAGLALGGIAVYAYVTRPVVPGEGRHTFVPGGRLTATVGFGGRF